MKFSIGVLKNINNPNSVHGIYPYRGKISARDAEQIINQMPVDSVLLDPFCGSGTIIYEAKKRGMKSIGVDLNPIAVDIARGKIEMSINADKEINLTKKIIEKAKKIEKSKQMPNESRKHFHGQTSDEIMRVASRLNEMSAYVKACFYGAIALSARGCNGYKWTSSTVGKDINPKQYINFYDKLLYKVKKHHHPTSKGSSRAILSDARQISKIIKPASVDFIFTSPPYFDCLDYTAYYAKIIFPIIGLNRSEVRKDLIQTFKDYKEDMRKALKELYKVCKKGASIIFVVGDKKIKGKLINGAEFFQEISPFSKVEIINRRYSNSSSQVFDKLNKTQREEQVIIWTK